MFSIDKNGILHAFLFVSMLICTCILKSDYSNCICVCIVILRDLSAVWNISYSPMYPIMKTKLEMACQMGNSTSEGVTFQMWKHGKLTEQRSVSYNSCFNSTVCSSSGQTLNIFYSEDTDLKLYNDSFWRCTDYKKNRFGSQFRRLLVYGMFVSISTRQIYWFN